jgi:hypothetical protein
MNNYLNLTKEESPFQHRVAILGCPSQPEVQWNRENLLKLRELGFNTLQLNIAWGGRPADEPLNLEDLVTLSESRLDAPNQPDLPPRSIPERRAERRQHLAQRIALAKQFGFRTIFHFGAPYNAQYGNVSDLNGRQMRSLLDPETTIYYTEMLGVFASDFSGVDDILVYTYDQDAWLTSEFGSCWLTRGHDLASRVVPFLEKLAHTWRHINGNGFLWWSPWELSAGQVYRCVSQINASNIGLDLHPNVAETMLTMPVDRWLRNTIQLASEKAMPVIVESFLGATSEETEPYQYLMHPHAVVRQVKSLASLNGVTGIKEYYGLNPSKWDPNLLAASSAMMSGADCSESSIIQATAAKAGMAAKPLEKAWELFSRAQEFFPWDLSWWVRELGTADVSHSLDAASLRGAQVPTPSWESTRRAIFMKNDDNPPHPWMLEDVQIRWEFAEKYFEEGLACLREALCMAPDVVRDVLNNTLRETQHMLRRVKAYRFHCRETNLVFMMRQFKTEGHPIPDALITELRNIMHADLLNQEAAGAEGVLTLQGAPWIWDAPHTDKNTRPWAARWFRKRFDVATTDKLQAATVICSASDRWLRFYINGSLIENFGFGPPPYKLEVAKFLNSGENEIMLRIFKAGSLYENPACCCVLSLEYENDNQRLLSDESWECCHDESFKQPVPATIVGLFGEPPLRGQGAGDGGVKLREALNCFENDLDSFIQTYFHVVPDSKSHGLFSVTSC